MAVTLIVEDGSVVVDANTFLDLADARDMIEELGFVLSTDDDEAAAQLTQGFYLLKRVYCGRLKGEPVSCMQEGIFPREGVYMCGELYPSDEIPKDVKRAQLAYASAIQSGVDFNAIGPTQQVKKEKLDGVGEVEYMDGSKFDTVPNVTPAHQYLCKFLSSGAMRIQRDDYFMDYSDGVI